MQRALELRKVGFVFPSLASSRLVKVTVLHKKAAELEVLLPCRSIFGQIQPHISIVGVFGTQKNTHLLNFSSCCTVVIMVLVSCGLHSGVMIYVGPHLKCYGLLMNPDLTVLVPSSDELVYVFHLSPFSFGHL